jgi:hypothetical protein
MTLDHDLHTHFDRLELWLEADDVRRAELCACLNNTILWQTTPNMYRVCSANDLITRNLPRIVTFKCHHGNFELPDPRFLRMHAACCRVAFMSGAAGYINNIMDDLDEG